MPLTQYRRSRRDGLQLSGEAGQLALDDVDIVPCGSIAEGVVECALQLVWQLLNNYSELVDLSSSIRCVDLSLLNSLIGSSKTCAELGIVEHGGCRRLLLLRTHAEPQELWPGVVYTL